MEKTHQRNEKVAYPFCWAMDCLVRFCTVGLERSLPGMESISRYRPRSDGETNTLLVPPCWLRVLLPYIWKLPLDAENIRVIESIWIYSFIVDWSMMHTGLSIQPGG
jgi:hypothetical protein